MTTPQSQRSLLSIDFSEFRLGWRILILALLGVVTSVGVAPLYSFSSLVLPLQEHFGWSREEIQRALSFLFASTIIALQISGWLIRRFGLRWVALISLFTLSLGYVLISLSTEIWHLYASYSLLAFAGMGTTLVTWTQLVNLWFERNRGLALAFILTGTGLSAVVMPSLLSAVIGAVDWRAGYWLLAALPLLLTLPLSLAWLRVNAPSVVAHVPGTSTPLLPGMPLRQVVRSGRYWLCNLALLLSVTSMLGMVTSTIPMLRDKGLSPSDAALAFSVFGIALVAGRVVVGYLVDRFWAPGVAFIILGLPALGCVIFASGSLEMTHLMLAAVLIGLGAGAEMDIAAFMMARYFGMRDYSRVFSLHMGIISLGAALAPMYFGHLYTLSGNYETLLTHCMVTFVLSAALIITLGRYPTFSVPVVPSDTPSTTVADSAVSLSHP